MDADCYVENDWLSQAINCFSRESADAVGSHHLIPEGYGWIGRTAELIQTKKKTSDGNYIPSGNMLVKRDSFESIGGFNSNLETNEDVDFCNRLIAAGGCVFLDSAIRCIHTGAPSNVKQMFLREVWHGKDTFGVFWSDLKKIRNLRIVLFSCMSLCTLIGLLISLITYLLNENLYPIVIFSIIYFSLNMFVAIRDWKQVGGRILPIFMYACIFGLARSVSLLYSLIRKNH